MGNARGSHRTFAKGPKARWSSGHLRTTGLLAESERWGFMNTLGLKGPEQVFRRTQVSSLAYLVTDLNDSAMVRQWSLARANPRADPTDVQATAWN
jgi:hypothetical protein